MFPQLPLDDLIGQTFYRDGATWRLLYNRAIRRLALRRIEAEIPFDRALALIASGELLWHPPEQLDLLGPDMSVASVTRQVALLDAFQRSPACTDSARRAQIVVWIAEARAWLSRHALPSGDAADGTPDGSA